MNPLLASAIFAIRSIGVVGVLSNTRSIPFLVHILLSSFVSSSGMSGTNNPFAPAAAISETKRSNPRW
jgi:hypothetical protein